MSKPSAAPSLSVDVLVIGSGFGGSVAALRLTEKGYRVTVIEAGRSFADEDFATSPWQVQRLLWAPRLGIHGIMRIRLRRRLLALNGVGVGGGSLAYAAVHYRPDATAFHAPGWDRTVDWAQELAPHYDRAEHMLGTTTVPGTSNGDRLLRQVADDLGVADTFHPTRVGIHLGPPGQQTSDPYFNGQGPARTGCTQCGQCTAGCPAGAKNTLVKNYLHLAERAGATIRPLTSATALHPHTDGTWHVHVRTRTTKPFQRQRPQIVAARQVVLAAGAWGTAELLHRSRPTLPGLSPALGTRTCTNRETITAVSGRRLDIGAGVAISSALRPDPNTLIQLCRVGTGAHPLTGALLPIPLPAPFRGFGRRTALLFTMERQDSTLTSHYLRGLFGRRLTFRAGTTRPEPVRLAAADALTQHFARHVQGRARRMTTTLLRIPFTAHLLGGCPLGTDPTHHVADPYHRVHGYPTLHIADASTIPANLGLNPGLTITAMAERAFAAWPQADTPDLRPRPGERYQPPSPMKVQPTPCPIPSSSASAEPASSPASHPGCCPASTSSPTASPADACSPAACSSPPSSSPPPVTEPA
ncbi:GMC oxidoreductase [Streptomyces agglomeratus]|uniref:GMC oxidoreductase n=1 Tax=Streptomyces agglomeratus TaxID=285458 RepID=UPI000AB88D75|nr:GMC family oxidoreductase [Streptomyces agglomeratus]